MKKLCYGGWLLLGLAVVSPLRASAETRTWNGPATGDWFTAVNWTPSDNYPQAGDTVVIATGSALLTNETAELAAFSITNATEGAGGGGGGWIAVWVQLSVAMRDQYLTGVTNRVYRQGTHRYFSGTATATNGSGWVNAGDAQVFPAQAGRVWFFTSALQQGTVL